MTCFLHLLCGNYVCHQQQATKNTLSIKEQHSAVLSIKQLYRFGICSHIGRVEETRTVFWWKNVIILRYSPFSFVHGCHLYKVLHIITEIAGTLHWILGSDNISRLPVTRLTTLEFVQAAVTSTQKSCNSCWSKDTLSPSKDSRKCRCSFKRVKRAITR